MTSAVADLISICKNEDSKFAIVYIKIDTRDHLKRDVLSFS
jgi:hypothetical protein